MPDGPTLDGPTLDGPTLDGPSVAGPTLDEAVALATRAHDGQLDKAGDEYIGHPLRVMATVAVTAHTAGVDPTAARIAAVLHDVVEDSGITLDELRALGYGPDVVAAVDALSKRPGEPIRDYLVRVAANDLAVVVKRADMGDNGDPARLARLPPGKADEYARRYSGRTRLLDDLVADRHARDARASTP